MSGTATLLLQNETVDNTGGTVQVSTTGATLNLQDVTIDDGTVTNAGALQAIGGSNTISNVDLFTNTGTLRVNGASTVLLLLNEAINNTGGTVHVNNASATLDLQDVTITDGTVTNIGLLEAISGSNTISGVDSFTNSGTLRVSGTAVLLLSSETVDNTGGTVHVSTTGAVLNLQGATIDDGTVTNAGLLEAVSGSNTISGVDSFTNSGTLRVSGTAVLLLSNETVDNTGGTVHVSTTGAVLNLQGATIDDGTVTNAGLLAAIGGSNTISNVDLFTNTGTLRVSGTATLLLQNETVDNTGGTVQVSTTGATLNLQDVTIDDGTVTNAGALQAIGGSNTISNVDLFTNTGTLLVTGATTSLLLQNETLDNSNGVVEVVTGAVINLNGVVIAGGLLTGQGTFATVVATVNTLDGSAQTLTIDTNTAVTVNTGVTLNLIGTINGGGKILVAGASTINATGIILVPIDASGLADDTLLTLTGDADLTVINLVGDLNAGLLTGVLTVTTGDNLVDNGIAITTGSNNTTITGIGANDLVTVDALALLETSLLKLSGASAFTVSNLVGDLNAAAAPLATLTGVLTVTTGNAVDNAITITTGTNTTTITANGAGDTATVHAAALANNTLLTLIGSAAFVVDGLKGDLDASLLTGVLTVTTGDNLADNGIAIATGSNNTTITGTGANDLVTVNALALLESSTLKLSGASAFTVSNLVGDLDASGLLLGTLDVTTGDAADNGIAITTGTGATTITRGTTAGRHRDGARRRCSPDNTLLTVDGASNFVVSGLQGDLDASGLLLGTLDVTTGDAADNAHRHHHRHRRDHHHAGDARPGRHRRRWRRGAARRTTRC